MITGLLFLTPAEASPAAGQEDEFMRQARFLTRRGDYDIALKVFNKIYDLNPKNTLARIEARKLRTLRDKNPESFFLTQKLRTIVLPEFKMDGAQYTAALKYLQDTLMITQEGQDSPIQINMIIEDISPEPPPITYSLRNVSWWDAFALVLQAGMLDCELRDKTFVIRKAD